MVKLARRAAHVPFALMVAAMFAAAAVLLVLAAPQAWLDALAGLVALPAPLAHRLLLAPVLALLVGGLTYLVLRPVELRMGWARSVRDWQDGGYAETPADTPLARRKPIFATDELGAPLMSDEVLELQTAQIIADPVAPAADAGPLGGGAPHLAAPRDDQRVAYDEDALAGYAIDPDDHSIAALIQRLEQGMARRAHPGPQHDIARERVVPLLDSFSDDAPAVGPPFEAQPVDDNLVRERMNALRRRLGD